MENLGSRTISKLWPSILAKRWGGGLDHRIETEETEHTTRVVGLHLLLFTILLNSPTRAVCWELYPVQK